MVVVRQDGAGAEVEPEQLSTGHLAGRCFAAYRDGDAHRLGELVTLVSPLLWRVARAHGCDPHAAQDVVQEVFLRLVDRATSIRDPGAVLGWLVVATKREAWRVARSARRDVHLYTGTVDPVSGEPGPEASAILTEQQQLLWGALKELNERCQQLLRIVAFVDRPDYDHVSAALGMPRGSIGPTRGRCLDKLRRSLTDDPRWAQG